jgi:hypothetical protein
MIDKWINDCEKNMSKESIDVKTEAEKSHFTSTAYSKKTEGFFFILKNNQFKKKLASFLISI